MSAYNPYFPQGYNPFQQAMQYQQALAQALPNSQLQNSSFIHVQSEAQAREWNVSPGGSVTFINDNEPYCYTKALGLSQFDSPVFKKFRLVEEHDTPQNAQNGSEIPVQSQGIDLSAYALKSDVEAVRALYDELSTRIDGLSKKTPTKRKEVVENEQSA